MKYLLLSTSVNKEAGRANSAVLASFEHERHAIYAADVRNAKAMREGQGNFYYSTMEHDTFWAGMPHHTGMEPQ